MATVTVKDLKIISESDKTGEVCSVSFAYSVECDEAERALSKDGLLKFEIQATLLGYDDWFDDNLRDLPTGTDFYQCGDGQFKIGPVVIPCKVLDEDVGEDEIYVKVTATSVGAPGGKEYTAEGSSDTVTLDR
jgi:hypothetical protein